MNFKKLITNTLAVVGAVVIIDRIVDVIKEKGTAAVSKAMLDEDFSEDESDDSCQCSFLDDDYEENLSSCQCDDNNCSGDDSIIFPEIKKYSNKNSDKNQVFEYAIKTEPTTSDIKEV